MWCLVFMKDKNLFWERRGVEYHGFCRHRVYAYDGCLEISVNATENILQTAQYWEHGAQTNSPARS
ncbi:hypothetical protein H4I95_07547 [Botrytis cinerea]